MSKSIAITEQQQEILDSLICERFGVNLSINKKILGRFENAKGRELIDYAKQEGFAEDQTGSTTYYLVKTKAEEGLFFFSLKCGELFSPLDSEDEIRERREDLLVFRQAVENAARDERQSRKIYEKLKSYSTAKGLSLSEIIDKVASSEKMKKDLLKALKNDKSIETNEKVVRVSKTFSGVQLVHFCANKRNITLWDGMGFPRHMGETLFWQFVVPIIEQVLSLVGCEYVFLFAADLSEGNSLIRYYHQVLGFDIEDSVGANKPTYDLCCSFMCQKVSSLIQNQKQFFASFNEVPTLEP